MELFYIVNNIQTFLDNNIVEYKVKYDSYRIIALEQMQLIATSVTKVQEYRELIKELIEKDSLSPQERQILLKMHCEHFNCT